MSDATVDDNPNAEVAVIDGGPLKGLAATPARSASAASMRCVAAKDREGWLALFAEDALVEDPVGPSPLSPEGTGHRGRDAIGAFWDMTIALIDVEFDIRGSYSAGNECANVGVIHSRLPGGMSMHTEGVFTYVLDDEGLLSNLRAHWDFGAAMATLAAAADTTTPDQRAQA